MTLLLATFTSTRAFASPSSSHLGQTIGYSVQGHPIMAYTVGWGTRPVVIIGGIHGGSEWATTDLVATAAEYFRLHAADIPPPLNLVFIPSANPDSLAVCHTRAGRFNAHQVDLNRNWDCGWKATSKWNETTVSGGSAPFSEPETQALRDYLLGLRPALVVFYHSKAGTVGAGVCAESLPASEEAARLVAKTTGYSYIDWSFYEVSGDAVGYLNQQGIPAIEIELWTHSNMDWEINLAGMRAIMEWAEGNSKLQSPNSKAP
ncbi:MAG: hypothetical protein HY023_08775 [Chloroflexi bacterium]|nr:hypothetical protein [Chloroflexota bacterium]